MDPQRETLGAPRVPKWSAKGTKWDTKASQMEPRGSHMDPEGNLMDPKGSHIRSKVAPRVATDTPKTHKIVPELVSKLVS